MRHKLLVLKLSFLHTVDLAFEEVMCTKNDEHPHAKVADDFYFLLAAVKLICKLTV
jgi:hypothetical protein